MTSYHRERNPSSASSRRADNSVNLYDPAGLRPITTEELDTYRKANSPK